MSEFLFFVANINAFNLKCPLMCLFSYCPPHRRSKVRVNNNTRSVQVIQGLPQARFSKGTICCHRPFFQPNLRHDFLFLATVSTPALAWSYKDDKMSGYDKLGHAKLK